MPTVEVPFGEWLPSAPSWKNPGCTVAENCIPYPGGSYGPLSALVAEDVTATGLMRGAVQFFLLSGLGVVVGGTTDSLFIVSPEGVLTETTGLPSLGPGGRWSFARFNDFVVAVGPNNAPRYLDDINTDTTWGLLPGSPPAAKAVARVGDFLMLGNLAGHENRIQWSAFNAPGGAWGTDRRTQAGWADLPLDLGAVQAIVGGRYPLAFQTHGLSRLEYVGPPSVWRRTTVEQERGCISPFSVASLGFVHYYLSADGFMATDGSSVQQISTNKVTRWFFDNADPDRLSDVHAAIDLQNECVMWAFKSIAPDHFDRLLIYSWSQNRWSSASVRLSRLVDVRIPGYTLEEMSALYPRLDEVPASLDDPRWKGKARGLGAFVDGDATTTLHHFRGLPMEARFETGEFQPEPGRRVMVGRAWPIVNDDAQASRVAVVPYQNDRSAVYSDFGHIGPDGSVPLRADGRSMRAAMTIPAGTIWRDAQGLQMQFRVSGRR